MKIKLKKKKKKSKNWRNKNNRQRKKNKRKLKNLQKRNKNIVKKILKYPNVFLLKITIQMKLPKSVFKKRKRNGKNKQRIVFAKKNLISVLETKKIKMINRNKKTGKIKRKNLKKKRKNKRKNKRNKKMKRKRKKKILVNCKNMKWKS